MMKLFGTFLFSVIFWQLSIATAAKLHWATKIEAQEVVLENEDEKFIFSSALEFRAARDQVLFLTTQDSRYNSRWMNGQTLRVPNVIFQRFLRLWKEAPLKGKIENAFSSWKNEGDWVVLHVKKALKQDKKAANKDHQVELLWLGCYDSEHLCLGMNDTFSNPNLLAPTVSQDEVRALSKKAIAEFQARTRSLTSFALAKKLNEVGFPNSLAQWYAVKLLSRRASLLGEQNTYLQQVQNFQYGDIIRDGMLMKNPEGLEVDFTFDRLDAKIRDFIYNRYEDVEGLAKYVLAHFPYMSYEFDKGTGGYHVGPGFMFRIKRKVIKNPHSNSPSNLYRINDSVDIIVTLSVGVSRSVGPASASLGAGPGYMRKYLFSSFASSKETASKSPWTLTKEVVTGAALDQMKAGQSFTVESGWLANVVLSGNIEVYKPSRIRPQGNITGLYRFLSRHYLYMEDDATALVGFGDSHGYEFSAQAFFRVVARIARLPVFNWSHVKGEQTGGVYRVPLKYLLTSGEVGRESEYRGRFPEVKYEADFVTKYLHMNIWFYKTTQSRWNGFIDFKPESEQGMANLVQRRHRFYLLESSADSSKRYSLGHNPESANCTTWAAFEADPQSPKTRFFDGTLKLTCSQFYSDKRPLSGYELAKITESLSMDLRDAQNGILAKSGESRQLELSWDVRMSWKDLAPLFTPGMNGWIDELHKEILALRNTARENITIDEEAHQRFVFVMAINHVLNQPTEEAKAKAFFDWISQSNTKDVILKFLLKKLKNSSVTLQVFRPHVQNHSLVEQNFSYGRFEETTAFQLIEEKNKWLGSN